MVDELIRELQSRGARVFDEVPGKKKFKAFDFSGQLVFCNK